MGRERARAEQVTFAVRCFATNPAFIPCDLDWSLDAVVGVAASMALAIAALGFFVMVYLLSKGRST